MALRAGYYGLKKKFIDKVNKWDQTVFPRSEQAILGAKNLLDTSIILNLYIDTTNMKYVSQGTPNICVAKVQPNTKYIITKQAGTNFRVATSQNYPANNVVVSSTYADHTGTEIQITTGANDNYLGIYTTQGDFPTCMVRIGTDTDPTYAPYAMTNKELTDSLAVKTLVPTLESTDFTFTADTKVLVSGNVVSVNFAITGGSLPVNTTKKIMTLPAGYKPSYLMHGVAYVKDVSTPAIRIFVDSSRQVSLLSPLAAVENKDIFGSITFINS